MINRILSSLMVVLILAACSSAQDKLTVDQYEKAISDTNVQILDVRTMGEYNSGYIRNALQADWMNRSQFDDRTQHLDKSKPVYVYCASGVRASSAADALSQRGFTVYNLEGGITAWKRAGKPVEGMSQAGKISADQYRQMVSQGLVLVDFGAPWCPPCKKMEPTMEEVKKMSEVKVQYVDGGANTNLMDEQKVEAMPTFILYKDGREVWRKQGIVSLEEFKSVIKANA
jgi:rhodanese-related sulfurtransferase